MEQLLDNKDLIRNMSHPEWIWQQRHSLAIAEIPLDAITKIVLGGKLMPLNPAMWD